MRGFLNFPDHHLLRCYGQPDRNASDIICTFQKQFLRKETDHHFLPDHHVLRRRSDPYLSGYSETADAEHDLGTDSSGMLKRIQHDRGKNLSSSRTFRKSCMRQLKLTAAPRRDSFSRLHFRFPKRSSQFWFCTMVSVTGTHTSQHSFIFRTKQSIRCSWFCVTS